MGLKEHRGYTRETDRRLHGLQELIKTIEAVNNFVWLLLSLQEPSCNTHLNYGEDIERWTQTQKHTDHLHGIKALLVMLQVWKIMAWSLDMGTMISFMFNLTFPDRYGNVMRTPNQTTTTTNISNLSWAAQIGINNNCDYFGLYCNSEMICVKLCWIIFTLSRNVLKWSW